MPREVGADSFPDSPFSPRNEDDQEVANGIKVKIIPPDRGKLHEMTFNFSMWL